MFVDRSCRASCPGAWYGKVDPYVFEGAKSRSTIARLKFLELTIDCLLLILGAAGSGTGLEYTDAELGVGETRVSQGAGGR